MPTSEHKIKPYYRSLRKEVAKELYPAITALFKEAPELDHHEKRQLTHEVNQILSSAIAFLSSIFSPNCLTIPGSAGG